MNTRWVGLLLIRDKKLLVVKERGKSFFVLPGGKIDEGESPLDALKRELEEELDVETLNIKKYNSYDLQGKSKKYVINFTVYKGEVKGNIQPVGDTEEILWLGKDYKERGIQLGAITSSGLLEQLIANKIVN